MAYYQPPTANVPIFDSAMFSGNRINPTGNVVAPSAFLAFPEAQGAEVFNYTQNGNQMTLGENGVAITQTVAIPAPANPMLRSAMLMDVAPNTLTTGIAFNAVGFAYDNGTSVNTIPWGNLQQKIDAIAPISAAINSYTLAINNSISIQDGETIQGIPDEAPTPNILLTSRSGINRIALSGDYGAVGNVLTSNGDAGSLYWGTGSTPGSVGTLGEVLNNGVNGNIASREIDMAEYDINNIGMVNSSNGVVVENLNGIGALYDNSLLLQATGGTQLEIKATTDANLEINGPTLNTANLTAINQSLPITINGTTYYVQLFT